MPDAANPKKPSVDAMLSSLDKSLVCFLWRSYRDAVDQAIDM
jgi:hypothetical protein